MNVLLISGIYPPDIGGPATNIPIFAEYLISKNHSVTVITLKKSDAEPQIGKWPIFYVNRDSLLILRFLKTLISILRESLSSDAIFANGLIQETGIVLALRPKKSVAKVVSDPVWERATNRKETKLGVEDFNNSELRLKHKLQRQLLTWSLNKFDAIICPSLQIKLIIQSWGVKKKVILIPNGVSENVIENKTATYDLVTVSRLINLKNIDKMIIASKETSTSLVIVGSGPDEIYLKQLAKSINANVTFLGEISHNEIPKILASSKIYLNLSTHEGLSYALLEAMACGLPSIVSNIPGNTQIISHKENGIIVSLDKADELNKAIKKLSSSNELCLAYGKSAQLIIRSQYVQSVQLDKIIELLK
jgi:glycosyltransferase involved in cell wall biosynthesis